MRPRCFGIATLSLVAMLFVATVASAAKPAFEVEPVLPSDPFTSLTPAPPQPNGPCTMGVNASPAYIINYLLPPDDAYYTLLDPANCSCPDGKIQINTAHLLLNFQVACAQPVTVRIVPAIDTGNGCLVPDPANPVCGPVGYNLAPAAPGNYQFNLPIPAGCCITQKVFLEIDFVAPGAGCSTAATRPRLITSATCVPCTSYNIYPGGNDDLCVDIGFPGNPIMWVDGDCCSSTPAGNASWGRLKSLYR